MKTIADLHMHTSVSQHAYSTLDEMAMAAKFKGFKAFGITNHGPGMLDGAMELHFLCLRNLPDELYGIRFYKGAEVNIKSYDGQLDLPESILKNLDIVIASYHAEAIAPASPADHTRGLIEILKNPDVDCLGHIGNPVFQCDYEAVIKACAHEEKLIEINSNSFIVRPGSDKNCKTVARLCMEYGVSVLVSSDAHSKYAVGSHDAALKMLRSISFPEKLIVNSDWDLLQRRLP